MLTIEEQIYNKLIESDTLQALYFKKTNLTGSQPKKMFHTSGNFEEDKSLIFDESNWNSGMDEYLHIWLSEFGKRKVGNLKLDTKYLDDDSILYINFKDNGKRKCYKVVRYKRRGNIEKFINLETNRKVTFIEYINILKNSEDINL